MCSQLAHYLRVIMERDNKTTYRQQSNKYSARARDNNPPARRQLKDDYDSDYDAAPRGKRRVERESYQERAYSTVPAGSFLHDKKKILIGLGAIAGIAIAAGIGSMISNAGKVRIVSVAPASVSAQQPYQKCDDVETTRYSRNHKNGTEGAVIGGVGGAAVGGLITHSWVGAGVGAAVGAVGGDLIQRSHQPDYVAHHSTSTECETVYRQIQVPIGYQVSYMGSNDQLLQMTTQHAPELGSKVALEQLQADEVTLQQQQTMVQQAIAAKPAN